MGAHMTEGWWKDAWPSKDHTNGFKEMKMAIKAVKHAKRGLSIENHQRALADLRKLIPGLVKEAEGQFAKLSLNLRKARTILKDLDALAQKEEAAIKPNMAPETVYRRNFATALQSKVSNKRVVADLPALNVEIKLMISLVNELRDKNAEGRLNDGFNKVFQARVDATAKHIDKAVKIHGMPLPRSVRNNITKLVEDEYQMTLPAELRKVPAAVIRKIGLNAKTARQYTIDKGMSVCKGIVGSAIGGVGVVVPGVQVVAIIAVARTGAALARDLVSSVASVEKKTKAIKVQLLVLKKMYSGAEAKAEKTGNNKKELTVGMVNTVLGVDTAPTVKKIDGDIKSVEGGIALLLVQHTDMTGVAKDLVDRCEKLKKDIESDIRKGGGVPADKVSQFKSLSAKMGKQIEATAKLGARISKAEDKLDKMREELKSLKQPDTKVSAAIDCADMMLSGAMTLFGTVDAAAIGRHSASVFVAAAGTLQEVAERLDDLR